MNYEQLGNTPEEYQHISRGVIQHGLITEPSLVLKLYEMHKKGKPFETSLVDQSRQFLQQEIRKGSISPHIGLRFGILSEDMLNVARWDADCPIVLQNQIYGYEHDLTSAQPLDIRNVGTFCIWEIGIVDYERLAWKTYLESPGTELDKEKYVKSALVGSL